MRARGLIEVKSESQLACLSRFLNFRPGGPSTSPPGRRLPEAFQTEKMNNLDEKKFAYVRHRGNLISQPIENLKYDPERNKQGRARAGIGLKIAPTRPDL